MSYNAKKQLYDFVDETKYKYGICGFPAKVLNFCNESDRIDVTLRKFNTKGLCAAAFVGSKKDTIILNTNRTDQELNFDCAHELIHLTKHRSQNIEIFSCFEKNNITQNPFLEWEANEGAAQALVPYQIFIPMYVDLCLKYPKDKFMFDIEKMLSKYFFVTENVIHNRIKSLQYEIYQYFDLKIPINIVSLKSNRQLIKEELQCLDAHKSYCLNCLSVVNKEKFCTICGNNLTGLHGKMKGLGYMKYAGVDTYDNGKAKECAVCHNDETDIKGDYCQICGTYLLNQCASAISDIPFSGEEECTHTEILPSNARYCPYCGHKTTFLENGLLKDWNYCDDDCDDIPDELPFF